MVTIKFSNRALYTIVFLMILIGAIGFAIAYGTNNPAVFGHSAGELSGVCLSNGTGCLSGSGGSSSATSGMQVKQVAFTNYGDGGGTVCMLMTNGKVACSGSGAKGVLGLGGGVIDGINHFITLPITYEIEKLYETSYGFFASYIKEDKIKLLAWGGNGDGQTGTNITGDPINRPYDVILHTEDTLIDLVAMKGYDYNYQSVCGIFNNGTKNYLKCWGDNSVGQLGLGDTTPRKTPTTVNLNGEVKMIRMSYQSRNSNDADSSTRGVHTCAVVFHNDRYEVKCWGDNSFGKLGIIGYVDRNIPSDVDGLGNEINMPIDMALTGKHAHATCIILGNGKVMCWGYNGVGQLGDGTTINKDVPVDVIGLDGSSPDSKAKKIVMTGATACVLLESGKVKCWGNGDYGELARGVNICVDNSTPDFVMTEDGQSNAILGEGNNKVKDIVMITSTFANPYISTICALLDDGMVYCWGDNTYGQLGRGYSSTTCATGKQSIALPVTGLSGVKSIFGGVHSVNGGGFCAILSDDSVKCWGYNGGTYARFGTGENKNFYLPVSPLPFDYSN